MFTLYSTSSIINGDINHQVPHHSQPRPVRTVKWNMTNCWMNTIMAGSPRASIINAAALTFTVSSLYRPDLYCVGGLVFTLRESLPLFWVWEHLSLSIYKAWREMLYLFAVWESRKDCVDEEKYLILGRTDFVWLILFQAVSLYLRKLFPIPCPGLQYV